MGLKYRCLSTDKPAVNLWFSFHVHLPFPLLLRPPVQRESSALCFCVQINSFFAKYFREALKAPDCQQTLLSWGSWSSCFSHTYGGQQSTVKSCPVNLVLWGGLAEAHTITRIVDLIRPLLGWAVLLEIPHTFPEEVQEKLCGNQGLVIPHPFCPQQNTQPGMPCHILLLVILLQKEIWSSIYQRAGESVEVTKLPQ